MTGHTLVALARMLIAGAWAQNRGRLSLTVAVVAIGVALGVAVHTLNYSAATELSLAVRSLSGEADLSVLAGAMGFSEEFYPKLAVRPEVAAISPALEIDAKLAGTAHTLRVIGIDPLRALALQPTLLGDATDRILDLLRADTVMLSTAAAQQLGLFEGGTLHVQVGLRSLALRVIAVLPVNDALRQPLALMDIAHAQWAFERLGQLTRIDLRLRPGYDPAAVIARVNAALPAGVQAIEPQMAARQSIALSRAYRVNLNMLALISLFTGAVLVFSAQALSLLRRRMHFALLRALGMTRPQLTAILIAEAGVLGVLGTALGIVLGIIAARFALTHAGADLGAGFFQGIRAQIRLDASGLSGIALAGIGACTLGGAIPAWEAASAPPAQALRAGDEQRAFDELPRLAPGVLVLLVGVGLLTLPSIDHLPVFGYVSIGCFLIGAMLLMPWYVRRALFAAPLSRLAPVRLALEQLRGAPAYAGISLATLLASFSLAVAMLIMIHSFRHSLDAWLGAVLPADLYVRAGPGASAWLDPAAQEHIRSTPGIARAVFSRQQTVQFDSARPLVTVIARDLEPARLEAVPLVAPQQLPPAGSIPVWVSEAMRDLYGAEVGQRLFLPLGGINAEVTVAGVWRDYVRQGGAVLINRTDYVRLTGDRLASQAWLWLEQGQSPAQAQHALRQTLGLGAEFELREASTIRARSLAIFDQTFAVTYALQFAALTIALFGIGIGFSAQAFARRSEFGMLHHVGMSRRELSIMLSAEGAFLGMLGAIAGLVVGGAMSYVLVHVINRQSFHWSMEMHWPTASLVSVSSALILCCTVTAAVGARRALGADAISAVREDW